MYVDVDINNQIAVNPKETKLSFFLLSTNNSICHHLLYVKESQYVIHKTKVQSWLLLLKLQNR